MLSPSGFKKAELIRLSARLNPASSIPYFVVQPSMGPLLTDSMDEDGLQENQFGCELWSAPMEICLVDGLSKRCVKAQIVANEHQPTSGGGTNMYFHFAPSNNNNLASREMILSGLD